MSTALRKEFSKAKKIAHPNSRKSIAIAKRTKKITNRQKAKMGGLIKQTLIGEKMVWIKEHMLPDICPYTPELTAQLLETYIARHDEEMEQINIKRSVSGKRHRQHASREDVLRMTKEREQEEYDTCGIEIPDILTASQCEMLRNWNGDLRYITNFKFRRFGKTHLNDALQKLNKQIKVHTNETQDQDPEKLKNIVTEVIPENTESTSLNKSDVSTKNNQTNYSMETD
ncbi:translation machinery-associated protein 16 [Calliopsis andreniformis]|uniref:translation machinery-associated protein 16 n=1 Tax=Calliopsis andreniformis TaxID=337506 RepID=UPI003FCCC747